MSNTVQHNMRVYHRYLGYFLAGIMAVYAISGIILIFRETDFLKKEKQFEKKLVPQITDAEQLSKELKIKGLKIEKEDSTFIYYKQGSYNKVSGIANYKIKVQPFIVEKMTKLHKANTKQPLFYLNIFFGLSLLFFVVSAFWMYLPKTSIFKKGLYFTLAGIVLTLLLILY